MTETNAGGEGGGQLGQGPGAGADSPGGLPVETPGEGTSGNQAEAAKTRATGERNVRRDASKTASQNFFRNEWGDGYDANMQVSRQGMEAHFSGRLRKLLEITGLDQHPDMVEAFHKMGRGDNETASTPSTSTSTGPAGGGASNVDTAQQALDDYFTENSELIRSNNPAFPSVAKTKKRWRELNSDLAQARGQDRLDTSRLVAGATTLETAQKAYDDYFNENSALILAQNDFAPGVREAKDRHGELNNNLARTKSLARLDGPGLKPDTSRVDTAQQAIDNFMAKNGKLLLNQNDMAPGVKEAKKRYRELNSHLARVRRGG